VLATMGLLGVEFRSGDDGAATEEKMCRGGGCGRLIRRTGEQRRRSVRMGNGSELWARGRRAQGARKRGWAGWGGGGFGRRGLGGACYLLLATCWLLLGAWFTGLLGLCQDSRSVPIASRPASIQLRGPSKSRDGIGERRQGATVGQRGRAGLARG
jgi:hypothetical protein